MAKKRGTSLMDVPFFRVSFYKLELNVITKLDQARQARYIYELFDLSQLVPDRRIMC